jgi:hypothetical protein
MRGGGAWEEDSRLGFRVVREVSDAHDYVPRSIEYRLSCCLFHAALPGMYGMSFATHGVPVHAHGARKSSTTDDV